MRECEHYQELMSRLLDGGLTQEEEASLREHVRTCPDCRQMLTAFSGMTSALREDLAEPPRDLARGVMERIAYEAEEPARRRKPARRGGSRSPGLWVRLGAAACLVLIAAGGVTAVLRGGPERNGAESAQLPPADMERDALYAPAEDTQAEAAAGAEEDAAGVPMTISTQDIPAAADADQAAGPEAALSEAATPSPEPVLEALPVYDAARNRIGVIPPENISAFAALITDAGWGDDGPPDVQWEYLLKVEYLGKTYAFATEPGTGALVWWEEPSTQVARAPGKLADLHALITMDAPALPE